MHSNPSALEPVRRSALLASIDDLSQPPAFLSTAIWTATRQTTANLRIVLFSPLFDGQPGAEQSDFSHTGHWDEVQRLLTYVYVQATKVSQDMGRVLMDIDVLLKGTQEEILEQLTAGSERIYCVAASEERLSLLPASIRGRSDVVALQAVEYSRVPLLTHPPSNPNPSLPSLFPVVALGGTFDHLHAGHKILLSMGAWVASEKLIVGITDDALLKNKAHKEVLEKLPVRMERVRAFLELFKPGLIYDLVSIDDVYGPTAWDPNIQALIVSKETLPGASSIHKHREEKSLPPLHTFVIDVISSTEASLDDRDAEALKNAKMSSTFIRQWIVQNQTRTENI